MLRQFLPSLKYVRKAHFPLRTRDLVPGTNEAQNFGVIMDAFLNMIVITKNLRLIRTALYPMIKEHKTSFENSLKTSLNIVITQHLNTLPL